MEELASVKICLVNSIPFIWKAKDVFHIRKEHRIIGKLTGGLPRFPAQNSLLGLPLQLTNEEARLLLEKGYAHLETADEESVSKMASTPKEICSKYENLREKLYKEQNDLYKEGRRNTIESMADTIVEGKRKRLLQKMQGIKGKKKKRSKETIAPELDEIPEIDRESALQEEIDKIKDVPRESCTVQLFTEPPWVKKETSEQPDFEFPKSEHGEIRYLVFKDLWNKGLYVTAGAKFGTDFLAYPGDPLQYHAFFMVLCTGYGEKLSGLDMVTLGRLSTQVKKTLVLATVKPDKTVDYLSLRWGGVDLT